MWKQVLSIGAYFLWMSYITCESLIDGLDEVFDGISNFLPLPVDFPYRCSLIWGAVCLHRRLWESNYKALPPANHLLRLSPSLVHSPCLTSNAFWWFSAQRSPSGWRPLLCFDVGWRVPVLMKWEAEPCRAWGRRVAWGLIGLGAGDEVVVVVAMLVSIHCYPAASLVPFAFSQWHTVFHYFNLWAMEVDLCGIVC